MKHKRRFQNPWGKGGEYYNQSAVGGSIDVEPPTPPISLVSGDNFHTGQTSTETPSSTTDSINTGRLLQYEDEETETYKPWTENGEYYPDNVLDSKDPNDPKSVLYTTAVVRQNHTNVEEGGFYYSKDGDFLGEIKGKKQAVRVVTEQYIGWKGSASETATNIAQIQKGINSDYAKSKKDLENLNTKYSEVVYDNKGNEISHSDFTYCAGVILKEDKNYEAMLFIAYTTRNYANFKKMTMASLLKTGYSRVPKNEKKELNDKINDDNVNISARKAVINVLMNGEDISNGSELWDGVDFLAWGLHHAPSEASKNNRHQKFNQYGLIKISKELFDIYKENCGTSISYMGRGWINPVEGGYVYNIPEAVFNNKNNWSNNEFSYATKVNDLALEATFVKGKTIYWKIIK